MEQYFIMGMFFGCVIGYVMHVILRISAKANAFEWELNHHKLETGIRRDKVIKDEKAAADQVTEQFTKQLAEIVSDNLVVDEDKRRDMVNYTVDVWTKFT